jgi:hypothetical protein
VLPKSSSFWIRKSNIRSTAGLFALKLLLTGYKSMIPCFIDYLIKLFFIISSYVCVIPNLRHIYSSSELGNEGRNSPLSTVDSRFDFFSRKSGIDALILYGVRNIGSYRFLDFYSRFFLQSSSSLRSAIVLKPFFLISLSSSKRALICFSYSLSSSLNSISASKSSASLSN